MSTQDVIGVFDSNLNQLFPNARSVRAMISPKSKGAQHPLETGGTFGDNVVDLPVTIELSVIIDPADLRNTYQQIKAAKAARNLLLVQTTVDTFSNMMILDIPFDQTAEMFDTVAVAIRLEEFILVNAQYAQLPASSVKKKSNASTVDTGQKNSTPATPAQTSAAYDLFFGGQ